MVSWTDVCPALGGIAPPRSTSTSCESFVRNTPACDLPFWNGIVALPESGGWFDPASDGGGLTHRYGGGGANPSSSGLLAKMLRFPDSAAAAMYTAAAAIPTATVALLLMGFATLVDLLNRVRKEVGCAPSPAEAATRLPRDRPGATPRSRSPLAGSSPPPGSPDGRTEGRCRSGGCPPAGSRSGRRPRS